MSASGLALAPVLLPLAGALGCVMLAGRPSWQERFSLFAGFANLLAALDEAESSLRDEGGEPSGALTVTLTPPSHTPGPWPGASPGSTASCSPSGMRRRWRG